jgi:hypothetical protein
MEVVIRPPVMRMVFLLIPPTLPPLYVPVDVEYETWNWQGPVLELARQAQMHVLVRAQRNPRSRTGRAPY